MLKVKARPIRHWTAPINGAYAFAATACFPQPEAYFQRENARRGRRQSPWRQAGNDKAVLQKMVDAFSLKFQRDNRKNALAVAPVAILLQSSAAIV